ncbi:MAG: hypothetical protein ISR61_00550 [Desulfobacteraceae bacterium]|nr:hypothetical protein [Desulfobacteraceae bacterium]
MKSDIQTFGKFRYFFLVNGMLLGNISANLIGDFITNIFLAHRSLDASEGLLSLLRHLDIAYGIICMGVIFIITIWYERPIRRCIRQFADSAEPDPGLLDSARRRLLNEPYMVVLMDIVIWGFGSIMFAFMGSPGGLSMGIAGGLITIMIAFFFVEHVSSTIWSLCFSLMVVFQKLKGSDPSTCKSGWGLSFFRCQSFLSPLST